jgi:tetraacyldisaccharide 4'-kinase
VGWVHDSLERVWYPETGKPQHRLLDIALAPLGGLYRLGLALRVPTRARRVEGNPTVIAIGNLTIGGSGKTPLTLALAERLVSVGRRVAILSRGYGRASHGPQVVHLPDCEFAKVERVGDEPLMLARRCPAVAVVVAEQRLAAAALAQWAWQPQVLVLDDAFQHRGIARDQNILAVHAKRGFGNGHVFPRGPLREPLTAMRRASLVVFTHVRGESIDELRTRHGIPPEVPAVRVAFMPEGFSVGATLEPASFDVTSGPVLVVCAVADPQGFLATCREAQLTVARLMAFPDHHRFSDADRARMAVTARECDAQAMVTTEKDLVRLGTVPGLQMFGLRITAKFLDEETYPSVHARLFGSDGK